MKKLKSRDDIFAEINKYTHSNKYEEKYTNDELYNDLIRENFITISTSIKSIERLILQ